jgi:Ca2+-binding EF-hand superfamily protein
MNKHFGIALGACLLAITSAGAVAQDRAAYDQRNIARFTDLFQRLDADRDGIVTRTEAHGNLDLLPVFQDVDLDGDDAITAAELNRFLAARFGMRPDDAVARAVSAPPATRTAP